MKVIFGFLVGLVCFAYGDTIRGEAILREKMVLPTNITFTAILQDVSRADVAAITIGETTVVSAKFPLKFSIDFDKSKIDPRYSYSVRAAIHQGSKLLYTTDTYYPVITRGAIDRVRVILKKVSSAEPELPASFSGILPCADCEGIEYHFNLLPNHIFYLSAKYLGKKERENRFDDIGTYTSKNKMITFRGERQTPFYFMIWERNVLRKLGPRGEFLVSDLNYNLNRDITFQPISPRLFMRGMYSYVADAAVFKTCSTGQIVSVAHEKENLELEQAYLNTKRIDNQPVMALIEGEIVQRPNMEGNLSTLVIHKFLRVDSSQNCFP